MLEKHDDTSLHIHVANRTRPWKPAVSALYVARIHLHPFAEKQVSPMCFLSFLSDRILRKWRVGEGTWKIRKGQYKSPCRCPCAVPPACHVTDLSKLRLERGEKKEGGGNLGHTADVKLALYAPSQWLLLKRLLDSVDSLPKRSSEILQATNRTEITEGKWRPNSWCWTQDR